MDCPAVIAFVLIGGIIWWFANSHHSTTLPGRGNLLANDIAPGHNGAILTLSNGATVLLDSAQNGVLARQGQSRIIKQEGQLTYQSNEPAVNHSTILYNTVSTPRGREYQLTLADGTKVWLNAASSLTYPTSFSGSERKVEITGEAYFEVAQNAKMPFKVRINRDAEVEVLGTNFDINSYSDEKTIKTTLLDGVVSMIVAERKMLLKPGQQAIAENYPDASTQLTSDVDLDKVMAWKNGWFEFDQTDLGAIMRQVSRWYDVDIVYEGELTAEKFGGRISKELPLSNVIHSLEANGNGVTFRLEGRKLIVKRG